MTTLLDKARATPTTTGRTGENRKEMTELAVAYATGEITTAQVAEALGMKRTHVASKMAMRLLGAARRGEIAIEKNYTTD